MCGIVGYLGLRNAVDIVLTGLKRLEYRGYDSSGVCFKNAQGNLELHKKAGKLDNLVTALKGLEIKSHSCIGHTRWATHGEVSDTNAHPHMTDSMSVSGDNVLAIVHNGIIENAPHLKKMLEEKGYVFSSQTDSEVFLWLMSDALKSGLKFKQAVMHAFSQIHGNSAFVLERKGSEELLAIKRGAPLVVGTHEINFEVFVSSDPYALAGMASEIYFPEDEVLCVLSPLKQKGLEFFELDGTKSHRYTQKAMEMSADVAEKGHYEHFMLKEIYEQPGLIRFLSQYYAGGEGLKLLQDFKVANHGHIHIVACGTAWHAGLLVKHFLEKFNRVQCSVELASEFRYKDPMIHSTDLGVFISQSGETADTLAAQELCKKRGIKTLAVVNVEGSSLYRSCDNNFLIRAGMEIGVASTKAFTLQVLTGRLLSLAVQNNFKVGAVNREIFKKFHLLSERIDELLNKQSEEIRSVAEAIYNSKGFIFTGRGPFYPIALEGALKLKEIAYVHAEGYAAGELKHGPIALIDDQMVNIAIVAPDLYDKTISNVQEVKARKGIIVILGPAGDEVLKAQSDYYIPLNFTDLDEFAPLYVNVVNQLLAYHMAHFLGTDIDQPRNLAKSVTVE